MSVLAAPDGQVWDMIVRQSHHVIPRNEPIKDIEKGYVIMKKIFVIGGGTMGLDIAQVFARKGFEVTVRDINDQIIAASEARLNKGLDKLVAKGKMDEAGKKAITDKMSFTTDLEKAADADLVVEAAIENLDIKKSIFADLDKICKPETILASNTSSISITAIAAATKRPDKVLGMHFFNPAPAMKLVEVIRGARTSNECFKAVYDCAAEIGKSPVEVGEAPGFVVNRILFPMINEAIIVLENGIASKEDIDTAMMYGANHKMGPLALADLVGLDICLAIMETIFTETGDSKYRPALTMKKMVRAGLLGQKTGEGFYKYD